MKVGKVVWCDVCRACCTPEYSTRRRGRLDEHYCPACKPRKKEREEIYLDHDQAAALVRAATSREEQLLVLLGLNAGLRASELVAVRYRDFDPAGGRLWVKSLKKKTRPRLPVYLAPELMDRLLELAGSLDPDDYLFGNVAHAHWGPAAAGPHPTRWWAGKTFKRLAAAAGLPARASIHSMRHYCAIRTLEQTGDLYFTKEQLRHSTIKTTERYLHLLPERAREKASQLRPLTGGEE